MKFTQYGTITWTSTPEQVTLVDQKEADAEIARLEKALADTEALWRQERDRRRELEKQRDELTAVIERARG